MRPIVIILALASFLFGMTLQANAAPQLEPGSITVSQGGTGTINLSLSGGTESYAGVNAKIILPDGITVTSISNGELLSAGFTSDYYLSGSEISVIAYSKNNTFSASSGELLLLNIKASDDMATGNYEVKFAASDSLINANALSNSEGTSITPTIKSGSISIQDFIDIDNDGLPDEWEYEYFGDLAQDGTGDYDDDGYTNAQEHANGTNPTVSEGDVLSGDVNGDNNINLADAVLALKIACGMRSTDVNTSADVNKDEKIGMEEVVFILQKIAE